MAALPRLYINVDADYDWLIALEFGRVDDGQPEENWHGVEERLGYLHDGPADRAPAVGFKMKEFSTFEPDDPALAEIWGEPLFDVPFLGLEAASAGQIAVATRRQFGIGESSLNRHFFDKATREEGEDALATWRMCLECGDSMAHFALGYTLYELGRFHEAYGHLRHYARIAPAQPWVQVWFGKGAEAIGELGEARAAYERAIELTDAGAEETDAPELLAALEAQRCG